MDKKKGRQVHIYSYKSRIVHVKLVESDVVHVSKVEGKALDVGPGGVEDDEVHQDLAAPLHLDWDVGGVDTQHVQTQPQPRAGLNHHGAYLENLFNIDWMQGDNYSSKVTT